MRSAVVTGANGFIGTALLRELSQNGVSVFAVVRSPASHIDQIKDLPGVRILYCEMAHIAQLPSMLCGPVDTFYHLAWEGATGQARGDAALQLQNVQWTLQAVDAAHRSGCERFVGVGSIAEADVCSSMNLDGTSPNVTSHYGSAKIAAHYMSKCECARLNLHHIWAQLANTYGIGDRSSNFVNHAAKMMLTGQDARFTSGEQLYDLVYVDDIAQGLRRIGDSGRSDHAYYIGSAQPRRLKEFIYMIRDAIDPGIQLHLGAIPFHGASLCEQDLDCAPLMRDTGYAPQTRFRDGIALTLRWLQGRS